MPEQPAKLCRMCAVLADSMSMVDRGPYFEQPAEFSAFERWNKGDFLGVERLFAKRWGQWLSAWISLSPIQSKPEGRRTQLTDLREARELAESSGLAKCQEVPSPPCRAASAA